MIDITKQYFSSFLRWTWTGGSGGLGGHCRESSPEDATHVAPWTWAAGLGGHLLEPIIREWPLHVTAELRIVCMCVKRWEGRLHMFLSSWHSDGAANIKQKFGAKMTGHPQIDDG